MPQAQVVCLQAGSADRIRPSAHACSPLAKPRAPLPPWPGMRLTNQWPSALQMLGQTSGCCQMLTTGGEHHDVVGCCCWSAVTCHGTHPPVRARAGHLIVQPVWLTAHFQPFARIQLHLTRGNQAARCTDRCSCLQRPRSIQPVAPGRRAHGALHRDPLPHTRPGAGVGPGPDQNR